jgi:HAD superfamily hydrolase (TIGR01662 family)
LIRGIAFDLGKTLLYFSGNWTDVIWESHRALGGFLEREGFELDGIRFATSFQREMEESQRTRAEDYRERPTEEIFLKVMAGFGFGALSQVQVKRALKVWYSISEKHWILAPGAKEIVEDLNREGHRLALITNAGDRENSNRLIDKAGVRGMFDPILISAEVGLRKPHPQVFRAVSEAWGLPASDLVMVGDSLLEDILGAKRAGWHQIWMKEYTDGWDDALLEEIEPEATAARLRDVPLQIRNLSKS